MKAPIIRIRATIRYITSYRCTACGRQQAGDTATLEVESPSGLAQFLDNPPQHSSHMPMGWASHLDTGFTCGCKKAVSASVKHRAVNILLGICHTAIVISMASLWITA